jgi:murein DD-endopeptidase MepM/ murein hydrolase activator NlpD
MGLFHGGALAKKLTRFPKKMRRNDMKKKSKIKYFVTIVPAVIILAIFGWFFATIFEGEKPTLNFVPKAAFLSQGQEFHLSVKDTKRGIRRVKVSISQEGRELTVLEKKFPFRGLMNREGIHRQDESFIIDPSELKLAQGRLDIQVQAWDYSRRGGGDGNMTLLQHRMTVDTIPPSIRAISRMHNINQGGSCLTIYQASSDCEKSGVFVNNDFFPGYPAQGKAGEGIHLAYFALPHNVAKDTSIYLWAKDQANNESKRSFNYHIRPKRFRTDRIKITDRFLDAILPYFASYSFSAEDTDIEKYIKINKDLRKENHLALIKLCEKSSPERFWEGSWLRLKNAATMARYGDKRLYFYKGKKIDEQFHLGVDLASLAHSPVMAGNGGRIIFAGKLGIYGLAVVIDHGQGLTSLYAHLSNIDVSSDQKVNKGEVIGQTGHTGLAAGDHLHFAVMVHGIPVNPIEWWDDHWIQDNVMRKLALLQ